MIKVGDVVKFFISGAQAQKTGTVIKIEGDFSTVWVDKDIKAYEIETIRLKKV